MSVDDLLHIRRAIALAAQAVAKGNHPFGALLVAPSGDVLLEAENAVITEKDPSRHAELVVVSTACRTLPKAVVESATLYTSCEPCMMCCGALFWCGVKKVVFSCSHSTVLLVSSRALLGTSGVQIIGPVLEEEGEALHATYWSQEGHIPTSPE